MTAMPQQQVVIYTRVSSKEQALGFSIAAQASLIREYCEKKGLRIIAEFSDDESAKTGGTRTEFRQMVEFIKKHPDCRTVVVEKLDRAYRNLADYLTLDQLDLELHLVKDGEVMSKTSTSSQRLMHGIRVLFARSVSENIAEEASKGMRQKAVEGGWPSFAPLGYKNVDDKCGIAPDATAAIVRDLFLRAEQGVSLRLLTRDAKDAGLTGKRGGPLAKATVAKLLQNPLYYGEFVWKGERYIGSYEPIIDKGLFDRVQDALHSRSKPKLNKYTFTFAGLLRCEVCDGLLSGDMKRKGEKTYIYYSCGGRQGCRAFYREELFETETLRALRSLQLGPKTRDWITGEIDGWLLKGIAAKRRDGERLAARIEEIERKLRQAYDDKLAGMIDEEFFRARSADWRADLADLKFRRADLAVSIDPAAVRAAAARPLELLETAADQYLTRKPGERRRLLAGLVSNYRVGTGTLSMQMRSPFDILARGVETGDWRPQRDSNPCWRRERALS
jgi:site-specific DNA recombinase